MLLLLQFIASSSGSAAGVFAAASSNSNRAESWAEHLPEARQPTDRRAVIAHGLQGDEGCALPDFHRDIKCGEECPGYIPRLARTSIHIHPHLGSKRRVLWRFGFSSDRREHALELIHSVVSGKKVKRTIA